MCWVASKGGRASLTLEARLFISETLFVSVLPRVVCESFLCLSLSLCCVFEPVQGRIGCSSGVGTGQL